MHIFPSLLAMITVKHSIKAVRFPYACLIEQSGTVMLLYSSQLLEKQKVMGFYRIFVRI